MKRADRPIRMLLTGGGTGGHLFPAIAAAEAMCARQPGSKIMFIGTRRKMDQTSLAGYGYEVKNIHCHGLKGKNIFELIKALTVLPLSLAEALIGIISFKPDVVLGVGGYVTGPVIAAAKILGKTTVIHEQNSIPGLANRKLGYLADSVCTSIPESGTFFPAKKIIFTGNPVRKPILELAKKDTDEKHSSSLTLLVLGGSQGAHRVNELVLEALTSYKDCLSVKLRVIHQTGTTDFDRVRDTYKRNGLDATVQPFFQDMVNVYKDADLVVSRAGATTLAELAILGKPAILIPYPFAADNHQDKNADHYVNGGGCVKLIEDELDGRILAEQIDIILVNKEKRLNMSEKMVNLSHPQAAEKIVDVCLRNIGK